MNVMLFSAGFGTRMRPLTNDLPKPLIKVAGKALIDHARDLLRPCSPSIIVANAHYKAEMVKAHLEGSEVICIEEAPEILDTGGGLRNALPLLGREPVFTLNTDAVWAGPNPLQALQRAWCPDRMDALLMCVPTHDATGHKGSGDFGLKSDGQLKRGKGLVFSGLQIIKTDMLGEIDAAAYSLNLLWDRMAQEGRLFGLRYTGDWCDVGTPEGIALAEAMLGAHRV